MGDVVRAKQFYSSVLPSKPYCSSTLSRTHSFNKVGDCVEFSMDAEISNLIGCFETRQVFPWTARRSNQSILKEINPEYSLERLMLKLKFQYFGHLI